MKRALKFVILLVTIVIMAGCVRDDTPTRSAITFSLYKTKKSEQKNSFSKGNDFKTRECRTKADRAKITKRPEKFLVNAFLENETTTPSGQPSFSMIPDFMHNQLVEWNPTSGSGRYEYSPIKYWPADPDREVKFFAYWLGEQKLGELGEQKLSLNSQTGDYTAEVKDVDGVTDMLYSDDVIATNQSGKVKFKMHHLLSNIVLQVQASETLSDDIEIKITEIKTGGIYPNGELTLTQKTSNSEGTTINPGTQNNHSVNWKPKGTPIKDKGVDSSTGLMVIPQTTRGVTLKVIYTFKQKNKLGKWVEYPNQELTVPLSQGITEWKTGKQYTYLMKITPNKIEFDKITIADWVSGTIEEEL